MLTTLVSTLLLSLHTRKRAVVVLTAPARSSEAMGGFALCWMLRMCRRCVHVACASRPCASCPCACEVAGSQLASEYVSWKQTTLFEPFFRMRQSYFNLTRSFLGLLVASEKMRKRKKNHLFNFPKMPKFEGIFRDVAGSLLFNAGLS